VVEPPGDALILAHVPSPRQYVEALADVPLFKLVTGKFPVTPVVNGKPVAFVNVALAGVPSTAPVPKVATPTTFNFFAMYTPPATVNAPVVLDCSKVPGIAKTLVAPVPPIVRLVVAPANAVNVAPELIDVANVGDVESTTLVVPVLVVTPVPPFKTFKVPAKVTAPVVAVEGVKPVVPALNEVTPPVDADHTAVPPLTVNTYPFVPIANLVALLVPLPRIKSPVVVIGDKALNAAVAVV
jgi:hypothetical protein